MRKKQLRQRLIKMLASNHICSQQSIQNESSTFTHSQLRASLSIIQPSGKAKQLPECVVMVMICTIATRDLGSRYLDTFYSYLKCGKSIFVSISYIWSMPWKLRSSLLLIVLRKCLFIPVFVQPLNIEETRYCLFENKHNFKKAMHAIDLL